MVRVNIDLELQNELIDLLLQEVPVAQTPEGRDMLLEGIPDHKSWTRDRNNSRIDLTLIINCLKATFVGEEMQPECWGLTIFIKNAHRTVKGVTTGRNLLDIQKKYRACLEKQLLQQQTPTVSLSNTLDHDEKSSLDQSVDPNETPPQEWEKITAHYLQTIRNKVDVASQPFTQLFLGPPEPIGRRTALQHLEIVTQHLLQFRNFIERTLLPETIATKRHMFTDQIHFLVEKTQSLTALIAESNGSHQGIPDKFADIQQELTYFDILSERRSEF